MLVHFLDGGYGPNLVARSSPPNGRNRRNPVIAGHAGKGPFTIPLRTLLIVRCQPVVFESTTYVPGDAAGGSRIRSIGPSRTTSTRMS